MSIRQIWVRSNFCLCTNGVSIWLSKEPCTAVQRSSALPSC